MKALDIRARMLLAALLPVALISTLLAGGFLLARFDDLQEAYQQRIRSAARQLAQASEFGLFSANQSQLQRLVQGALREPDLRWVAILDSQGNMLASAGDVGVRHPLVADAQGEQGFDNARSLDWLTQPVYASGINLDDLFQDAATKVSGVPNPLGHVVVEFSPQSVNHQKQTMLMLGALIGAGGLVFGLVLAVYLSGGVIRPIMRVTRMIEQIGKGNFKSVIDEHAVVARGDPLHDLQSNLHLMASRLAFAREDLEQQVVLATQALRERKEEAERANQAKSRFLAAASHDLRQPIHALGMFVTRLAQLPHDAQTGQLIANLEASVRAMQDLLDGLLDISRLEAGVVQVNEKPFALAALFEQLAYDLTQTAQDKGLSLRIRASALWVMSDAALLYRILLNLVGNALRYTEKGGVLVAARLARGGTQVRLQVWDSGIGIAPEHQESVFAEFFQVENPARDRSKGLGLGLNIVKRSAALLGHPLKLVSRPGLGTRFTLTLPLVSDALKLLPVLPVEPTLPDDLRGVVALVIEDDDLVRVALVGLLGGWGLDVVQAQGQQDACQRITEGVRPRLIISDYRLQDGPDGIKVVQLLRHQLGITVPACLMSGDTDPGLMQAAQVAGLTLLHKPVRPAKLRNLLRRLLLDQRDGVDLA